MSGPNTLPIIEKYSAEIEECMKRIEAHYFLQSKVVTALVRKKEALTELGKLPVVHDVHAYVEGVFDALRDEEKRLIDPSSDDKFDIDELRQTRQYQNVQYLLHLAGVAWPITLMDWKVNRTDEADNALGVESAELMELKLKEKYGYKRAMHLHKGPGNGAMMHRLQKNGFCEQVGIADRPWFTINTVLRKFINEDSDYPSDLVESFVELLSSLLGRELRDRWFEGRGSNVRGLRPKVDFFDLNEIYGLLNDTSWVDKRAIVRDAKIIASKEFEDDGEQKLDLKVYEMLLNFLGYSPGDVNDLLRNHEASTFSSQRSQLKDKLSAVVNFRKSFGAAFNEFVKARRLAKQNGEAVPVFAVNDWATQWLALSGDEAVDASKLSVAIKQKIASIGADIEDLKRKKKAQSKLRKVVAAQDEYPLERTSTNKVILDVFKSDFVDEIRKHNAYLAHHSCPYNVQVSELDPPPLQSDLNRHIDFHFHGMVLGDFIEMDDKFPEGMFLYIDASRSDSHETNDEFKKDIHRSLKLLAPGGVLLTEGIVASHDRTPRFQEIWEIFDDNPALKRQFNVEVVLDEDTNHPKAIMIQKRHENGYLDENDKRQVFDSNVHFASLEEVMDIEYWRIISRTRRKILKAVDYNRDIFIKLNDRLEHVLGDMFFEAALPNWYKQNHIDDLDRNKLNALRATLACGSIQEVRKMVLACVKSPDSELRLINSADVDRITSEFNLLVSDAITQQKAIPFHPFHGASLETLDPAHVHVIPRLGVPSSKHNQHNRLEAADIPNNKSLDSQKSKTNLDKKILQLKGTLGDLERDLGHKPILLMQFPDCVVGQLMKETLLRLLGPDDFKKYVEVVEVHFDSEPEREDLLIRNQVNVKRKISKYCKKGGILLGVGSWVNTDDKFGKFFKHHIGDDIFKAVLEEESKLRVFGVCFFEQIMADLIGKHFYEGRLATVPGSLEMGPVGVERYAEHPLFKDCPKQMAVAMTHGSHVNFPSSVLGHVKRDKIVPLASSTATKLPVAYEALNGKVIGVQFHPDIRLVDDNGDLSPDVSVVMEDVESNISPLQDVFGLPNSDTIWNNWRLAANSDGKPGVKGNCGEHVIVNALEHLGNDLRIQLAA